MKSVAALILIFLCIQAHAQQNTSVSFEKWISLKQVVAPLISADGKCVVYTATSTDWINNTYDNELWLSRGGETPFQLTRTTKAGSTSARFTPDSK